MHELVAQHASFAHRACGSSLGRFPILTVKIGAPRSNFNRKDWKPPHVKIGVKIGDQPNPPFLGIVQAMITSYYNNDSRGQARRDQRSKR